MISALLRLLCLTVAASTFVLGTAEAQPSNVAKKPKVRPDVLTAVLEKGTAMVGIFLAVPWQEPALLSSAPVAAQRAAIATAQQSLIAQLAGTQHIVLSSRRRNVPTLSLEVGLDALQVLQNSPLVEEVYLEEALGTGHVTEERAIDRSSSGLGP